MRATSSKWAASSSSSGRLPPGEGTAGWGDWGLADYTTTPISRFSSFVHEQRIAAAGRSHQGFRQLYLFMTLAARTYETPHINGQDSKGASPIKAMPPTSADAALSTGQLPLHTACLADRLSSKAHSTVSTQFDDYATHSSRLDGWGVSPVFIVFHLSWNASSFCRLLSRRISASGLSAETRPSSTVPARWARMVSSCMQNRGTGGLRRHCWVESKTGAPLYADL